MENVSNQQHQDDGGAHSSENGAGSREPNSQSGAKRCAFDSLCSAFRNGANDAKIAAAKAIPKVKSAAKDAGYWVSYGISFAAVFQWTLAKHLTPECVKSGYRDGVKSGKETAEKWAEDWKRQREDSPVTSPPLLESGTQETQPSAS